MTKLPIKLDEEELSPLPTPTPTPTPSDDEEEKTIKGGAGDELENDITGMKLSNPNPFEKRLHQLDPKLYLVKQQGKYKAYSRLCSSNLRRQPVILTDEEKKRLNVKQEKSIKMKMRLSMVLPKTKSIGIHVRDIGVY